MRLTKKRKGALSIAPLAVVGVAGLWAWVASESAFGQATDSSRLVAVRQLPALDPCAWDPPAGAYSNLSASLQPTQQLAALRPPSASSVIASIEQRAAGMRPRRSREPLVAHREGDATRLRTIADTYPTYTAVGINLQTNEVILQDNNLWSTRIFNRLDNTPPDADLTEAQKVIQGEETHIQFNNGVYVDPENGDIYSVESDTGDRMVVFAHDARGNAAPKRILNTPHRVYSIAVDEEREELYVTVEYPPEVVVYRKDAEGDEQPIRRILGDRTRLEGPHGIAVDVRNQLLYVNTWGQATSFRNPGTGRFNPPAINIYPLDASGDTPPVRVIQGDRTQLNWPGNMALNPDNGDLYVANDVEHSVLIFTGMAYVRGNVPPTRVIQGDQTALTYPTGVAIDTTNQELWVSNLGNASASAYPLMADGNVAPLRTIRSTPLEHESLTFGRTAAVAYDPNRQEILVPN